MSDKNNDNEFKVLALGIKKAIPPEIKKITLEDLHERVSIIEEMLGRIGALLPRPPIIPVSAKKRKYN